MTISISDCQAPLHPHAADGIRLFNAGKYFEAHEALEVAWLEEKGKIRDLYRGILQVGVVYLHISRGNFNGAIKVFKRSQRWLDGWPRICRGIHVEGLRRESETVIREVLRLGEERIGEFDLGLLKPVEWEERPMKEKQSFICDRCGSEMFERNCKIICSNCGNRFDCSDLNLHFD